MMKTLSSTLLAFSLLSNAMAHAALTPEEACLRDRAKAAGKYADCQYKVLAKDYGGNAFDDTQVGFFRCRSRYVATWDRLRAAAAGTGATCDRPRFTENGNGTVTDNLTALQWEKKTNDGGIHDKDNTYTWSTTSDANSSDADGTVFLTFMSALRSGTCFAGQCDWRLPTLNELQTILLPEPWACASLPCMDEATFGPVGLGLYWSEITDPRQLQTAWVVGAADGGITAEYKGYDVYVRAVRGGL